MTLHAPRPIPRPPTYLMCAPQHFAVTYSINPWMDPHSWAASGEALRATAAAQWAGLHRALLAAGAALEELAAEPDLPDLVFTANAAVVLDRKALLARFRHPERQREQPAYASALRALQARGLVDAVMEMPDGVALEGAGDCLWDRSRGLFWMGCGFRSDATARGAIENAFGVRCLPLALADPRFYHLDTAMCALSGDVIYYPGAFTPDALYLIHAHVEPAQRIALSDEDAERFAANAVCFGQVIVMSDCSDALERTLAERGYAVVKTPLQAFLRSGGSACCLTLRLDHASGLGESAMPAPRLAAG